MIAGRVGGDRRGLTLIELVLTLTILAVAGALVSGAFTTGLRAWQSGARSGREELVARIVLERIAVQVRAAVLSPARLKGEDAVAFDAGEDHLRFVTLAASGAAPVQVFYGLAGEGEARSLVYREYPWPDKEFFGEGRPRREERVEEIMELTVKVARRDEAPGSDTEPPTETWSPLDLELPGSVTVEIAVRASPGPEPLRYRITVPVITQGAL
jgi:prepilin-type N-terminal cleavage/methylation domain-containing protein